MSAKVGAGLLGTEVSLKVHVAQGEVGESSPLGFGPWMTGYNRRRSELCTEVGLALPTPASHPDPAWCRSPKSHMVLHGVQEYAGRMWPHPAMEGTLTLVAKLKRSPWNLHSECVEDLSPIMSNFDTIFYIECSMHSENRHFFPTIPWKSLKDDPKSRCKSKLKPISKNGNSLQPDSQILAS